MPVTMGFRAKSRLEDIDSLSKKLSKLGFGMRCKDYNIRSLGDKKYEIVIENLPEGYQEPIRETLGEALKPFGKIL